MTLSRLFLCEKNVIILLSYRNHSCSRQAFCLTPSSQGAKPSYEAQMPSYMIKFRSSLPPHMGSLYTPHTRGTSHLQENTLFRVHTTSHQIVLHSQNSIQGSNSKALLHPPPREREGRPQSKTSNYPPPTKPLSYHSLAKPFVLLRNQAVRSAYSANTAYEWKQILISSSRLIKSLSFLSFSSTNHTHGKKPSSILQGTHRQPLVRQREYLSP